MNCASADARPTRFLGIVVRIGHERAQAVKICRLAIVENFTVAFYLMARLPPAYRDLLLTGHQRTAKLPRVRVPATTPQSRVHNDPTTEGAELVNVVAGTGELGWNDRRLAAASKRGQSLWLTIVSAELNLVLMEVVTLSASGGDALFEDLLRRVVGSVVNRSPPTCPGVVSSQFS
jgi:hypothetical protein